MKYRKQIIILLLLILLWFYFLSFLRVRKSFFYGFFVGMVFITSFWIWVKMADTNILPVLDMGHQPQTKTEKIVEVVPEEIIIDQNKVEELYTQNEDLVGWLSIADTPISYPVMQHLENEDYYLDKDFYKQDNENGTLILDNDSDMEKPTTNLLIHGHNMKSGAMFGTLEKYVNIDYYKEHQLIQLETLKETRNYIITDVFYSQVFYEDEDVFKYYKFFQADSIEEWEDFYINMKELSLYDTGVQAIYKDQLLMLSTCAYQTENGRFVVVAKRIY